MRRAWPPLAAASLLAAALVLPMPASAQVLVVGDSLEEGTGPHLQRELGDLAVTVDARRGRPSGEGLEVLRARLRPEHEVVVFDLGTNDDPSQPQLLAANLRSARELAGGRCMVVATLQRPPLNGVTVDGLDAAVRDFAAQTSPVQLVDWRGATVDPGVLVADRIHATPEGYALRARLVAEGVRACLAGEAAPLPPADRLPRSRRSPPGVRVPAFRSPREAVSALLGSPLRLLLAAVGRTVGVLTTTPEPVLGE